MMKRILDGLQKTVEVDNVCRAFVHIDIHSDIDRELHLRIVDELMHHESHGFLTFGRCSHSLQRLSSQGKNSRFVRIEQES